MRRFLLLILILFSQYISAQTGLLNRSVPESEGVPTCVLNKLMDSLMAVPNTSIHSLMILRHGNVIGEYFPEPFKPEYLHTMYSCSKTFVAAAIGIAIDEGKLSLNRRVADYYSMIHPDSINFNMMTVKDLLMMSSGITPDWNMRNNYKVWTAVWLSKTIKEPGKEFMYDSMCTYMLSAILQKAVGMKLIDYLKLKLFYPMGIKEVEWEESPEGINTGGWGLHIQTEALAMFGQLLLNKGKWGNKRLISVDWVSSMMKKQIETGLYGYGFQTWMCEYPSAVRADGAFGQYILIIPDKDMVVVITECSSINGQRQRNLVWNILMPEVSNKLIHKNRKITYKTFRLPFVCGKDDIHEGSAVQNVFNKTISLEENPLRWKKIKIIRNDSRNFLLTMTSSQGESIIPLSYQSWKITETDQYPIYSIDAMSRFKGIDDKFVIAGNYGVDDTCFFIRLHYVNWITVLDLLCKINDNGLIEIEYKVNHEAQWKCLVVHAVS
jgi:hypothetical protein